MSKEFEVKNEAGIVEKLVIRDLEPKDFEDADRVYAAKIAGLIRHSDGKELLLRTELDEYLRKNGIWTDKDINKVTELNKKIDNGIKKLRRGGVKYSEGREMALAVIDSRREIAQVMAKRRIFDEATVESSAESEKIEYLMFLSVVNKEDGQRYWDTFDEMKKKKNTEVYRAASDAAMEVLYGIDSKFERNLPEYKWLLKNKFIDEDLNYLDRKSGNKVDRFGKPLAQVEAEIKETIELLNGDIVEEQPFVDDE